MLKLLISLYCLLPSICAAETIHYAINQMGVKAGDATLAFKGNVRYNNEDLVLIEFKADGFNFLDQEQIYVNPTDYRPRFVNRNLNIFGKKETISEEYQSNQIVINKTAAGKTTQQIIANAIGVDNIYGFIYRFRRDGKFELGETFTINLPTKKLKIKVAKEWPLTVAGKSYTSVYLQSDPAKYKIWFDSTDKKLPLRISGAMGIANTTMVMTAYEE